MGGANIELAAIAINDNEIVMGYPAVPLKEFIKNNKKNEQN